MKTTARRYQWIATVCEHCDGEHQTQFQLDKPPAPWLAWGRDDYLRGYVCPKCDSALDEMTGESPRRQGGAA